MESRIKVYRSLKVRTKNLMIRDWYFYVEIFFRTKLFIVELYLSSEISYQELAIEEGNTNPSMIVNWVSRFRAAGPDALRPHKKGRKKLWISLR